MNKININEIYGPIIQGEGKRTGIRSSFVRTNGCNLRCEWKNTDGTTTKCDTPYTSWNPETPQMYTIEQIINKLNEFQFENEIHDIIISGGEPMLQPSINHLIDNLVNEQNKYVTVETNGTIFKDMKTHPNLYSISPKLQSSTPTTDEKARLLHIKSRVFDNSIEKYVKGLEQKLFDCQFKFVYNQPEDIIEIEQFRSLYNIKKSDIWLMPQGDTIDLQLQNTRKTMNQAIKYGYNMSGRLHVIAYDDQRGV